MSFWQANSKLAIGQKSVAVPAEVQGQYYENNKIDLQILDAPDRHRGHNYAAVAKLAGESGSVLPDQCAADDGGSGGG
eukprot:COSAG06_NODE_3903_length_4790_cov_53.937527_4_plen_78_part_00